MGQSLTGFGDSIHIRVERASAKEEKTGILPDQQEALLPTEGVPAKEDEADVQAG